MKKTGEGAGLRNSPPALVQALQELNNPKGTRSPEYLAETLREAVDTMDLRQP